MPCQVYSRLLHPLNGVFATTILSKVTPGEGSVWRLLCAVLAATMVLAASTGVFAAGAPIRKPPVTVGGGGTPAPSSPTSGQGTGQVPIFGGCGGRRIRDPKTGQCRGPADIGR